MRALRRVLGVCLAALLGVTSADADPRAPAEARVALERQRSRFAEALDRASWRRDDPSLRAVADEVTVEALSVLDDAPGLDGEVRPFRIEDELSRGRIVIVAGYQGMSYRREITTLGRGGSDTTAVALAAALGAARCEIYSDVDGVYSADPRVVPDARHIPAMGYEELQEMAECGAKVLNAEAVAFAKRERIDDTFVIVTDISLPVVTSPGLVTFKPLDMAPRARIIALGAVHGPSIRGSTRKVDPPGALHDPAWGTPSDQGRGRVADRQRRSAARCEPLSTMACLFLPGPLQSYQALSRFA